MSENEQKEQNTVTTDDLIFTLGEKETTIILKNKQISQLNSYVKVLNNKLKEMGASQETEENLKRRVEELDAENRDLKEENKKYQEFKSDNERLSRILKEKQKRIEELKEGINKENNEAQETAENSTDIDNIEKMEW